MATVTDLSFQDHVRRSGAVDNHRGVVVNGYGKMQRPTEMKTSWFVNTLCIPEIGMKLLEDGMLNIPLDFTSASDIIDVDVSVFIKKSKDGGDGKTTSIGGCHRLLYFSDSRDWAVHINPSDIDFQVRLGYDVIGDDGTGTIDDGRRKHAAGNILGCNGLVLDFAAQCGLKAIETRGMDLRNLAMKARLMLLQNIMHQTVKGAELMAVEGSVDLPHMSYSQVLHCANKYELLIDCSSMSTACASLLLILTRQWPTRKLVIDGKKSDVYSKLYVAADNALLYTSRNEYLHVDAAYDFGTSDELWQVIIELFNSLKCLDQLFDVFKETAGFPGFVQIMANWVGKDEYLIRSSYPTSRGANYILEMRGNHLSVAQAPQFISTSAYWILDGMLGMQCFNRMHVLVEGLGLGNPELYSGVGEDDMTALLNSHGFTAQSKLNELSSDVCPWMRCMAVVSNIFVPFLLKYAKKVRDLQIRGDTAFDPDNMPALALLKCDPKPDKVGSAELAYSEQKITTDSILHAYAYAMNTGSIRNTINWLKLVGADRTGYCASGMTTYGDSRVPAPSNMMRQAWSHLNGTYTIGHISVLLNKVVTANSCRHRTVATMFRPADHAVARLLPSGNGYVRPSLERKIKTTPSATRINDVDTIIEEGTRPYIDTTNKTQVTGVPTAGVKPTGQTTREGDQNVVPTVEKLVPPSPNERVKGASFDEFMMSPHIIIPTSGDGKCGVHALLQSIGRPDTPDGVKEVESLLGTNILPSEQWTDDSLGTVASMLGYNLRVINSSDKTVVLYDSGKASEATIRYVGDGLTGHFEAVRFTEPLPKSVIDRQVRVKPPTKSEAARSLKVMDALGKRKVLNELPKVKGKSLDIRIPDFLDVRPKENGSQLTSAISPPDDREVLFTEDTLDDSK